MKLRSILFNAATTLFFCAACCIEAQASSPAPISLRVGEGFENPIGFYRSDPVFSWKLPAGTKVASQSAYEIVAASDPALLPASADLWRSGKVESDRSVWVEYGGKKLGSRQRVYWQVRYWDQRGQASEWSETARFELGLLDNADWQAHWIGDPYPEKPAQSKHSTNLYAAQYLRREFSVEPQVARARLYITATGVFEAMINGRKVGRAVMSPGYTPYHKRIETLTFDVSDMLAGGRNAIGVSIAPGWNTSRIAWSPSQYVEREPPKAICQLEVTYADGRMERILSDSTWRSTNKGPIRTSEIYDGEVYDQNMELNGWSEVGFRDTEWSAAAAGQTDPEVRLQPKRHAPVVNKMELPARNLTRSASGAAIFDMGQNMVGVPRVKVPMAKGDTLVVRFAEMLKDDGELYTANYRTAHSTNYFIAARDGHVEYLPTFTFHGFRYVELSGFAPGAVPDASWVTGVVQYSDFDMTGSFTSSDPMLDQLNSNIIWGLRGNFYDIPTDCPQRDERMGWTGDAQVFAPTAYCIADVHAFFAAWMQSVREEQLPSGGIPVVVPNVSKDRVSPGWGDAVTVIPWEAYMRTGDANILRENYRAMRGWVDYYMANRKEGVIDLKGFGDWLQPFSSRGNYGETPENYIATAYCAYSIWLTMRSAEALGYASDRAQLATLYEDVRSSFENHFFDAEGTLTVKETQTGYLMALGFELLKDGRKAAGAVKNLVAMIEKADCHLGTGFLGTPLLTAVLDKAGYSDLAHTILFKRTYPSWFYSIDQGATTMWERWNSYSKEKGFGNADMNSFNHYAYGAVGRWMYERIGGIAPLAPGYKKILIAPRPARQLTFARSEYESPYGRIVSGWSLGKQGVEMNVVIPPNTTARIIIPCDTGARVAVNGKALGKNKAVGAIGSDAGGITIEVGPGDYLIEAKNL